MKNIKMSKKEQELRSRIKVLAEAIDLNKEEGVTVEYVLTFILVVNKVMTQEMMSYMNEGMTKRDVEYMLMDSSKAAYEELEELMRSGI